MYSIENNIRLSIGFESAACHIMNFYDFLNEKNVSCLIGFGWFVGLFGVYISHSLLWNIDIYWISPKKGAQFLS